MVAALVLLWGATAQAAEPGCLPEPQGISRQVPALGACLLAATRPAAPGEQPGKGCCSWHGGQCDCAKGRVVCCDGSLSPTCRCRDAGRALPSSEAP